MARYITLNLVNDQGTPLPWPGTPTQFELGTQESVVAVWIGVSLDGSDNQIYPLSTPAATILQSWPHLYQGVQVSVVPGADESPLEPGPNEYVYYTSLEEFNRLVAACCVAQSDGESPACMVTVFYNFVRDAFDGNFFIDVDGDTVVNLTDTGSGSIQVPAGAEITASVQSSDQFSGCIYEGPDNGGEALDCQSGANGGVQLGPVVAECGQDYFVEGFTSIPPP